MVVSASPSQLRVRVGVDATFVCRVDGQIATSQQIRWSRPVGVRRPYIHALMHYSSQGCCQKFVLTMYKNVLGLILRDV